MILPRALVNGSGVVDVVSALDEWNIAPRTASCLGGFVTKTVTVRPRTGHPQPWAEVLSPGTLVNAAGLPNPGIDAALAQWPARIAALDIPVIVSVGGTDEDLTELATRLNTQNWVDAIEINLSCPNVVGASRLGSVRQVESATDAVVAATDRPVLVKLSAACGDPAAYARAAEAAGAAALTCGNTMPVYVTGIDDQPLVGAGTRAGMSGTGVHAINLRLVHDVACAVDIPVVGLGGVDSIAAARRMLDAGARVIGVGTGAVFDPDLIAQLAAADSLERPVTIGARSTSTPG